MSNQTSTMRSSFSTGAPTAPVNPRAARGMRGLSLSPNFGQLPGRVNGLGGASKLSVGRIGSLGDVETLGITPLVYYGVSYASSFLGGSAVGYVVSKKGRGAVTGGLTSSGIWCMAQGLGGSRTAPPLVTAGLVMASVGSLWLAWTRKS